MSETAVLESTDNAVQATPPHVRLPHAPGATEFSTPDGVVDAGTHEGLRLALGLIEVGSWDCEAARAVIAALRERCASWAAQRAAASRVWLDQGEVLSAGWETLASSPERVAASKAPWAYLWTCVQHHLGWRIAADALLSEKTVRWHREDWPVVLRAGLSSLAGDGENVDPALLLLSENATSDAIEAFVAHLAGGDAAERAFWSDAVSRALHVMEGARRSYEEVELRRDAYLRDALGLSLDELSALAALLIGPRRGDRAAHSLLLALRRDADASAADVERAPARMRLLTHRAHAASAAATVAVAA